MRGQGVEGLEVVNVSFLQELLSTIADQGRALLPRSLFGGRRRAAAQAARDREPEAVAAGGVIDHVG